MNYIVDIEKGKLEGKYEFEANNQYEFAQQIAALTSYLIIEDFEKLKLIKIRKVEPLNESNNV